MFTKTFNIFTAIILTFIFGCKSKLEVNNLKSGVEVTDFSVTAPDETIAGSSITIAWSEIKNAEYYNLVISSDDQCKDQVISFARLNTTTTTLAMQAAGTYYICVFASINSNVFQANRETVKFVVLSGENLITNVSSTTSDGVYGIGSVIQISVEYEEKVNVTGAVKLKLETGTVDREATYLSGSGTDTIVFEYTVQTGDSTETLDAHNSDNQIILNGGSVKNAIGIASSLNLPTGSEAGALPILKAIAIDGVSPTVGTNALTTNAMTTTPTSIQVNWTAADDNITGTLSYKLVYSVSDNITTLSDAQTNGTSVNAYAAGITSDTIGGLSQNTTYYFNVLVKDAAGNVSVYAKGSATTPTGPAVSSVTTTTSDGVYTIGEIIEIKVTYDESVTVIGGVPTLLLETGTTDRVATYVSGSPGTELIFEYTVQAGDSTIDLDANSTAPQIVTLGASITSTATTAIASLSVPTGVAAGSLKSVSEIAIDAIAPAVGTTTLAFPGANTTTSAIRVSWTAATDNMTIATDLEYKLVFSTSDNISTLADALANGTAVNAYAANILFDTKTGLTPYTTYYFNVIVKDELGNESVYAKGSTMTLAEPPEATLVDTLKADGTYAAGEVIDIKVTFDENVTVSGSGTPTLKLETGTSDTLASYTGGSGTSILTFRYTVASGDISSDLDVHATAPQIALNGATIRSATTSANVTLSVPKAADTGSLAGSHAIVIEGEAPSVSTPTLTVAAEDLTTKTVRLRWTAATDNVTAGANLEYKLVYSTSDNISTVATAETNGTTILNYTANTLVGQATALTAGTTYYFNVIVKDQAGNKTTYTKLSQATESFCGGTGTSGDAYQICTLGDLHSMRDSLTSYYKLMNSIDASASSTWYNGAGWLPVGDNTTNFSGGFDGQGYTIKGLTMNRPTTDYVGLFGYAVESMTRVGLRDVNIVGKDYVGAAVGYFLMAGKAISGSYSSGSITGEDYVGGLIGYIRGNVTNSFSTASVTGVDSVGGLIGATNLIGSTLSRCSASGKVVAAATDTSLGIGGLVGTHYGTLNFGYATGNVVNTGSNTGGLVGYNAGALNYAWASGNLKGTTAVGGLAGRTVNGSVTLSHSQSHVFGTGTSVGGLVGYHTGTSSITNALATGKVISAGGGGSLIGAHLNTPTLTKSYAYNRSGKDCYGDDPSNAACIHVTTGFVRPFDAISFDPIFDFVKTKKAEGVALRKVSVSDESAYKIWGGCNSEGATINVTGAVTTTTTCNNYSWAVTLDLSGLADGDLTLSFDQAGLGTKSLTLNKDTAYCKANTTNNAAGFAGPDTNTGASAALAHRICTPEQFQVIKTINSAAYYKLENNLDLSTQEGPLKMGSACAAGGGTCPRMDGNGHTLSNFYYSGTGSQAAIFGRGGNNSDDIKSLGAENNFITSTAGSAGMFFGDYQGGIQNSYASGGLISSGNNVGGIIGKLGCCPNTAKSGLMNATNILGASYLGGIMGWITHSMNSTKSYNVGNIIGGSTTGGVVGYQVNPLSEAYNTGTVITSGNTSGGVIGSRDAYTLSNTYNTGNVLAAGTSIGGLVGSSRLNSSSMYSSGTVITTSTSAGGLIGNFNSDTSAYTATNSFAVGAVASTSSSAGALIGNLNATMTNDVVNSYFWDNGLVPSDCVGAENGLTLTSCTGDNNTTLPARFTGDTGETPTGGAWEPLSSWNFTTVWEFNGTNVLPTLQWQTP